MVTIRNCDKNYGQEASHLTIEPLQLALNVKFDANGISFPEVTKQCFWQWRQHIFVETGIVVT